MLEFQLLTERGRSHSTCWGLAGRCRAVLRSPVPGKGEALLESQCALPQGPQQATQRKSGYFSTRPATVLRESGRRHSKKSSGSKEDRELRLRANIADISQLYPDSPQRLGERGAGGELKAVPRKRAQSSMASPAARSICFGPVHLSSSGPGHVKRCRMGEVGGKARSCCQWQVGPPQPTHLSLEGCPLKPSRLQKRRKGSWRILHSRQPDPITVTE